jgi:hypothetical protein
MAAKSGKSAKTAATTGQRATSGGMHETLITSIWLYYRRRRRRRADIIAHFPK